MEVDMNPLRFLLAGVVIAMFGVVACGSDDGPQSNEERRASCPTPTVALLGIGQVCTADCDCETGLCYGEQYVAPNKICTRPCEGGCGDGFSCVQFSTVHWEKYDMDYHTICMPTCSTVADCTAISSIYTYCPPSNGMSQWNYQTVSGKPTCQTENKTAVE